MPELCEIQNCQLDWSKHCLGFAHLGLCLYWLVCGQAVGKENEMSERGQAILRCIKRKKTADRGGENLAPSWFQYCSFLILKVADSFV